MRLAEYEIVRPDPPDSWCPLCRHDVDKLDVIWLGVTRWFDGWDARYWHLVIHHKWVPYGGWDAAAERWKSAA